jgi:hypothetical protein
LTHFSNDRQEAFLRMTLMGLRVEGQQIPMKRTFLDICEEGAAGTARERS